MDSLKCVVIFFLVFLSFEQLCEAHAGQWGSKPAPPRDHSLRDRAHCFLKPSYGYHHKETKPYIRFYWDPLSRSCQEFKYGGFGGNRNNFKTLEECKKSCDPFYPYPRRG